MSHDEPTIDDLHRRCARLRHKAAELAADLTMTASIDAVASGLVGVDVELDQVIADLDALSARLAEPIAAAQRSQVSSSAGSDGPLRLNIGSGPNHLVGWVNVDLEHGDVVADCRRPLPFGDGTASHIYACHVLEHLRHPDEAYGFLRECHRILSLGGKVRIVVPNIDTYLRSHVNADASFWETHRETWPWSRVEANRLDQTLYYAGASVPDDNFFGHRHGYDEVSLLYIMQEAGLAPVRISGYQKSADPVFRVDDRSAVAGVEHGGRPLSLFAEGFHIF